MLAHAMSANVAGVATLAVIGGSVLALALLLRKNTAKTILWSRNKYALSLENAISPKLLESSQQHEIIELNPNEVGTCLMIPSVSCITFYEGIAPIKDIEKRLIEIIKANPWLACRLVRSKTKGVIGLYPTSPTLTSTSLGRYFSVHSDDSLRPDMPYEEISKRTVCYTAKTGNDCLDKDEATFKVTVINMSHATDHNAVPRRFALVVSLCHVLGDGHTFYKIYSMLNHPSTAGNAIAPVFPLVATRRSDFPSQFRKIQGDALHDWLLSPWLLIGLLTSLFKKAATVSVSLVNEEWIAQQKKAAAVSMTISKDQRAGISWISTNDILTSWFANLFGNEFILIAINFRNRIEGYSDALAGNYESMIVYSNEDALTPLLIRESLTTGQFKSCTDKTPTILQSIRNNMGVITNWSTFYSDVEFPDCVQLVHFPLLGTSKLDMMFEDLGVIFKPCKGKLAVLLGTKSITKDQLKSSPVLREFLL